MERVVVSACPFFPEHGDEEDPMPCVEIPDIDEYEDDEMTYPEPKLIRTCQFKWRYGDSTGITELEITNNKVYAFLMSYKHDHVVEVNLSLRCPVSFTSTIKNRPSSLDDLLGKFADKAYHTIEDIRLCAYDSITGYLLYTNSRKMLAHVRHYARGDW